MQCCTKKTRASHGQILTSILQKLIFEDKYVVSLSHEMQYFSQNIPIYDKYWKIQLVEIRFKPLASWVYLHLGSICSTSVSFNFSFLLLFFMVVSKSGSYKLFNLLLVLRLPRSVLEVSKKMLTEASRNPVAATVEKEAGWFLLSSLLYSMPKQVYD